MQKTTDQAPIVIFLLTMSHLPLIVIGAFLFTAYVPFPWSFGVAPILGILTAWCNIQSRTDNPANKSLQIYALLIGTVIALVLIRAHFLYRESLIDRGLPLYRGSSFSEMMMENNLNFAAHILFVITWCSIYLASLLRRRSKPPEAE